MNCLYAAESGRSMPSKFLTLHNWMSMTRLFTTNLLLLAALAFPPISLAQPLLMLRDDPAPGALLIGQTEPDAKVWLDDQTLRVNQQGYFLFDFDHDAEDEQLLRVEAEQGQREHLITLQPRQWNIQRVEGVPTHTMTPPKEQLKRIHAETTLVQAARQTDSNLAKFADQFVWPT